MATWADLADCTDPVVVVEEAQLEQADIAIGAMLRRLGIGADAETDMSADGLALLRRLAVQIGTAEAATASMQSGGQDDVMRAKADSYRRMAQETARLVDRESLGLAAAGSGAAGWGSITVGRA